MANNPVGWFEIYVQDMARAKKFYEAVFQLILERLNNPELEMWSFPMAMDREKKCPLARTDSLPWPLIPKAICLVCIQCNSDHEARSLWQIVNTP